MALAMEASTFWSRDTIGPGPYPDVSKIPSPPLQTAGVFIMFVLPAIAIFVYGGRVYTRYAMKTIGLDDYLAGLALVMAILVSSTLFMFFKLNYYGWEDDKVPDYDPSAGLWWNFVEQLCYNPVLALVKASILVFLLRLGGHDSTIYRVIWALMVFNILHAVAVFFGALFQCVPIHANWHPEIRQDPSTRCIDNSFHIIQSSITILTDVSVLALPFWIFLGLRMPKGQKMAVLGVFLIGIMVPIVAIIRLVNIYRLLYLGEKSRHYNIAYVWTAVEVNLAVISCSMPALRPLLSKWFPSVFGNYSGDKSSDQPYPNAYGASTNVTSNTTGRSHARESHYALKDLGHSGRKMHTEIRGVSPSGSEEEIMTYNGILRTTNVAIQYDDAKQFNTKRGDGSSNMSNDLA